MNNESATPPIARVVAVGASNLTRGLHTVLSSARASWGASVEVLVASGHGRSYGARSHWGPRALPGILESGLWRKLEHLPTARTRGLITDVGNDIVYGASAVQTLAWVEETADRLCRITSDIVLTDLPLARIKRLSPAQFHVFRSVVVPQCRRSLAQVLETAEQVQEGLATLASERHLRFFHLKPEWYGIDPIHIRVSQWRPAWREILGSGGDARDPWWEPWQLYLMPAERRWILGQERVTPQVGVRLPSGGRVWLF